MNVPTGWVLVRKTIDGAAYRRESDGLQVIASHTVELDGFEWWHVSLSRKSRIPTYDDMALVKRLFLGDAAYAYQVFPPIDRHVNIHPYCLHLFAREDGFQALPDFTRGGSTI